MPRRRRPKKPCLLCGSTAAISDEHVIPKWVGRALQIKGEVEEYSGDVRVHTLEALAIVLPQVCEDCNNGWLSRLEERTRPVLEPMLLGGKRSDPRIIDPSQQATLATWAVKTSLLLTYRKVRKTQHGWIPKDNLKWLHEHRDSDQPPPAARVWIGGLEAEGKVTSSVQAACIYNADHMPEAYCGTFSVGYVLFQVFCCELRNAPLSPENEAWLEARGPYRSSLLPITPSWSAIRWPPEAVFRIDALQTVAGRLRDGLSGQASESA